jgi:hypothetical protein
MQVLPKKSAPRHKGTEPIPNDVSQFYSFPAPIRGWVLNENLANPQPGGARILDNWICTTSGIKVRGGAKKYATLGAAVTALWSYKSGATEKFFGATASAIYDITTVVNVNTAPTPVVSGRTGGNYATVQFGTPGGDFMYIVNGVDKPLLYNGTNFTAIDDVSSPAITGVTTTTFSHVWSFASRLFFVEKDTLSAWYLPVDSVGGAATEFSLAGIFTKGGSLMFGAKWSMDAGDGLDDKCVFVSTEGEVAIYEGTNPSSAADWRKVGLYEMPKIMGINAKTQAGGDLLIATEVGLVPVSAAVRTDIAALEQAAVSKPIAPYWQKQARTSTSRRWEMVKIPRKNIMLVSHPTSEAGMACLCVNLQTGAWSRFTGWDTQCLGYFADEGYFGAADFGVYGIDQTGSDNGAIYTCVYLGQHDHMGAYGREKTVLQMRATFQSTTSLNPYLSALPDFQEEVGMPPSAPPVQGGARWDVDNWDEGFWDASESFSQSLFWTAVGVSGSWIAPELQLSFGSVVQPSAELVALDAEFVSGATVT